MRLHNALLGFSLSSLIAAAPRAQLLGIFGAEPELPVLKLPYGTYRATYFDSKSDVSSLSFRRDSADSNV